MDFERYVKIGEKFGKTGDELEGWVQRQVAVEEQERAQEREERQRE